VPCRITCQKAPGTCGKTRSLRLPVLDDETPEAAERRRKTFIAISTGVIAHLRAHLEVIVAAGKFAASIPNAQVKITGTSEIQ